MESLPMQTVCIILSLNILRGQIAKGVKIYKGFRFDLHLQNILRYSMVTANLNKCEDFVTNTTSASKYITKGGFFSESATCFLNVQVSKKNIPKNYPEFEI